MPWLRKLVNKMGGPVKDAAQRISGYQPLPEYDDPQGAEWTLLKSILKKWTDEFSAPAIIMPIPLYHYVEETASPDACRERFGEASFRKGVKIHDPLPDYYAIDQSERRSLRFEKDIHPTPAHHRLLADSLSKAVIPFIAPHVEEAAI